MASIRRTPAEQRSVLVAAREVLAELAGDASGLSGCAGVELAEVMGLADSVAAGAGAARVAVAVEAARREGLTCGELRAWVAGHAPSLRQGGAAAVARVAAEVVAPSRVAGLSGGGPVEPDADSAVGVVWASVRSGALGPGNAVGVLGEVARMVDRLVPEAVPTVTGALVELVVGHGPGTMKRLRPRLLAEHGRPGELDEVQERLRSGAFLSTRWVESADLTRYELALTPEQAATLEAAVGPLSKPQPNEQTGERDLRPAGQRRAEALAVVCARSAGLDADAAGSVDAAASAGSVLHVTVDLADLEERTGYGEVVGSTADGTLLGPEQLRRIGCDALLVPYVLGAAGEVVDQGVAVRLFTRAQRRRLWRRDRGCTFPGCTVPATWTRAHHVRHWTDGGPSDISNAALLCQRHHTVVHSRRLWAEVRERPDGHGRCVVWDLHEGSYDRALERLAREGPPDAAARRRAAAVAAVVQAARARVAEHDERALAAWYDRDIDDILTADPCPHTHAAA